jgi:hypothetical protein
MDFITAAIIVSITAEFRMIEDNALFGPFKGCRTIGSHRPLIVDTRVDPAGNPYRIEDRSSPAKDGTEALKINTATAPVAGTSLPG